MPLCSDPSAYVPYVLKTDRAKADPPKFQIRFLTEKEHRRARALFLEAGETKDDDAQDAKLTELYSLCLSGWAGMTFRGEAVPFSRPVDHFFLSGGEKFDLARACIEEPLLKEKELGESESRLQSGLAPSAAPAAAEGA